MERRRGGYKQLPSWIGGVAAASADGVVDQLNMSDRSHNRVQMKTRRRQLRRNLTPAEATLWRVLRNSKFRGRKFRRQYSVGKYVIDFYCVEEWLGIELDGEVHRNEIAMRYDHERKLYLNGRGIKLVRSENYLVFEELDFVLDRIESNFGWWKEK